MEDWLEAIWNLQIMILRARYELSFIWPNGALASWALSLREFVAECEQFQMDLLRPWGDGLRWMNGEAKYNALLKALVLLQGVKNAEDILCEVIAISKETHLALENSFPPSLSSLGGEPHKTILGFLVEVGNWMPANKAMIFGKFGAVITDFETGECKTASKEDLERALRNITKEKSGKHE